jgi:hypothetical protein
MKEGVGSISQRYGSGDPDPPQNVTDPQHWLIHRRVHIHKEYRYQSVPYVPASELGTPPPPSRKRVPYAPPPRNQMRVRGSGGVLHLFISMVPSPRSQ